MQRLTLRHGDCVEVLKGYEDGSIGAFICDPPYDLTAVSRGGSARQFVDNPYGRSRVGTDRKGFMGKTWDGTGIAFSADLWDEVYRVLRPGGVVKAFSGTRTFHRMALAMREAGFVDLRVESWNYGSGFPKSLNIGKALDKAAGAKRGVIGKDPNYHSEGERTGTHGFAGDRDASKYQYTSEPGLLTAPATPEAQKWDGWGTALKPSWEPVVVGRKPE